MTTRERRERRAERLRDWSEKREERGRAELERSRELASAIPFGQPIASNSRRGADERYRERIGAAMDRGVENLRTAESMSDRARSIERAAERAIYSDDVDAVEKLRERVGELEAERERIKQENAAYRREHGAELRALTPYARNQAMPHPSYVLQNLGGNITRNRKRFEQLQRERVEGPRDRIISARFASACADCGAELERGQTIRYNRQQGARCMECAA